MASDKAHSIVFTGGGSAGHVTPNFGLMEHFAARHWGIEYIGSLNGIERSLVERRGVPYHGIHTGKFRRYFSLKNLSDQFKILRGLWDAFWLLRRLKPRVVFSKGGFVTFPVVVGAWCNRIPVVIHESDSSPGLATRLCAPFADAIAVTFITTSSAFKPSKRVMHTGTPIRSELLAGNAQKGREFARCAPDERLLLVFGGSLGAKAINAAIREALAKLPPGLKVVHICGAGNMAPDLQSNPIYFQFEFLHEEFPHLLAAADVVVCRAGANSLYELLALAKPSILIPLSKKASRGDQIENASYFTSQGWSKVIQEEDLTSATLVQAVIEMLEGGSRYSDAMRRANVPDSKKLLTELIEDVAKSR